MFRFPYLPRCYHTVNKLSWGSYPFTFIQKLYFFSHFLKYLMQRGEITSQAAGMHSASPWSALLYQEHLRLLRTSYCCAAQRKAFGLDAGRSRAVSSIYPTNCTSHWVLPGQAWAVCSSESVQTAQKGSTGISAGYSSRCMYTSGPHAFSSCSQRQLKLDFVYTSTLIPRYWFPIQEHFLVTMLLYTVNKCTKFIY